MFLLRPTPNCLLLSGALAGLASLFSLPAQTTLPPGPGADLVYAKCQPCHDMGVVIQSAGIARPMWLGVMAEMKEFGMKVTPDEHEALVGYLATYLGPDPPPVPDNKPTAPVASALDGAKLFDRHCSACHGKDGKGVSEQVPPLAGNPYLFKDSRYTIAVLLHGLQGPIAIKGRTYEGVMPGFPHFSGPEIAAAANYIVNAWGNRESLPSDFEVIGPDLVQEVRTKMHAPEEVHKRRLKLR